MPYNSVGNKYEIKINKTVSYLKKKGADFQLITASENNAWLLNIRGQDSEFSPVPHSYILLDKQKNLKFFCDTEKISGNFKRYFKKIKFFELNSLKNVLSNIKKKIYN